MELNGAKILYTIHTDIPLLGDLKITQTLVTTWIVMALLSGLAIWLGSNLKLENVSKRQAAAEFIVERLDQFVHDNMGYHFDKYIPLIGSIFALSIGCNLISVIGLWSPTADLNTEAAWAIVVFVLIMYYKIKTNGIFSYLKGLWTRSSSWHPSMCCRRSRPPSAWRSVTLATSCPVQSSPHCCTGRWQA